MRDCAENNRRGADERGGRSGKYVMHAGDSSRPDDKGSQGQRTGHALYGAEKMSETILAGVITGVIMLAAGALFGRLSVRTKTSNEVTELTRGLKQTNIRLEEHIEESEERNELILESLLAIMLTLKKGAANGEIDGALERLNCYTIRKGSK